jgi:uncharacterized protein YprB with RNaseH-like and TPR domain
VDLSSLGGEWRADNVFVVERRFEPTAAHGRETIGTLSERLTRTASEASMFAGGAPARAPFMFFDLETTGLNGGAGTHVFLIGCAGFAGDGAFLTRQFVMTRFTDERSMLRAAADDIGACGAIVSFNGKSFDAPVLDTRYLFHRLEWDGLSRPHVDVLHPARRFWKGDGECSLVALERQLLGVRRAGDVDGFEIPERYFHFVRSGDARPLVPVLEHNRLDLLSLASLTARLLHLVHAGPSETRDGLEALALGRVYARAGYDGRARAAFERAVNCPGVARTVRLDGLRSLALLFRRTRRFEEAADCWRSLAEVPGCPAHLEREAAEALAIHHEHRKRDFEAARTFALRSLENGEGNPRKWTEAVHHRLARLEKKLSKQLEPATERPLFPSSLWPPSSGFPTSARRTSS